MYMRPSFLWSTVVTQSCRTSSTRRRGGVIVVSICAGVWVAIGIFFRTLFERRQICCNGVEVVLVEVHGGHENSGLEGGGVVDEGAQVGGRVGERTGGDGVAAGEMGEVWAEASGGDGSRDGVATDADTVLEDGASGCGLRLVAIDGGLLLTSYPGSEVGGAVGIDAEEHFGVLDAAILRALAEVEAWGLGIEPHGVNLIRDEVQSCRRDEESRSCGRCLPRSW